MFLLLLDVDNGLHHANLSVHYVVVRLHVGVHGPHCYTPSLHAGARGRGARAASSLGPSAWWCDLVLGVICRLLIIAFSVQVDRGTVPKNKI